MKKLILLSLILLCAAYVAADPRSDRRALFSGEEVSFGTAYEIGDHSFLQGQDTIYYDDGYGFWYSTVGVEWGVRFSTSIPCTLHSVLTMTFGVGADCSLFVRDDSSGFPGTIVREATYPGGSYPGWDRIDLSPPYYDMNCFWITGRYQKPPHIIADSANDGGRSYYRFDGGTWFSYSSGDLMMRAIVSYGDTLAHDIAVVDLRGLPTGVVVDSQYIDTIYVANYGSSVDSFPIEFQVMDSTGLTEFDTLLQVESLPPRAVGRYAVAWIPQSHGKTYHVLARSFLPGDLNPGNDTLGTTVYSYMDGETYYDDFSSEVWLNVDRDDNDKFAVMYQPAVIPCYVTGARFFVNDTLSFESMTLCPDADGLPDTTNPYVQVSDLSAAAHGEWVYSAFDTSLTYLDADTVWLVLTWPDSRAGPHVGSDVDYPVAGRSWAYSDSTGWVNWTDSDFMMRIVCAPATGVQDIEHRSVRGELRLRALPNPFYTCTHLTLAGSPAFDGVSLAAFDLAGRCVKIFDDGEVGELVRGSSLSWNGNDGGARRLPPGVYFLVLRTGSGSAATKAVMLR